MTIVSVEMCSAREARPASLFYRLRKTAARNRTAVVFVTLLAASLLIGSAVSVRQAIRATRAEEQLAEQLAVATRLAREAEERTRLERWERYRSTMDAVSNALDSAEDVELARRRLDAAPEEHRGWEWAHFDSRIQDASLTTLDFGTIDFSYCPVFALHPKSWQIAMHQPDGSAAIWEPGSLRESVDNIEYANGAMAIAYSTDGKLIAVAADDHVVHIWNTETRERVCRLVGHEKTVLRISFHPNSMRIATGGFDRSVRIWDVKTGDSKFVYPSASQCMALEYSPDGSQLMIGAGTDVVSIHSDEYTVMTRFQGPTASVATATLSLNGNLLACGTSHPENGTFVWDFKSGELLAEMRGHSNEVTRIAFNSTGSQIASASMDQTLRLWDVQSGQSRHVLRGHAEPIFSLALSPDGTRLVSGSTDETARVWDTETGNQVVVLRGHTAAVAQVAFSHDGSQIVSASFDGTIRLWDSQLDGSVLHGHTQFVYDVTFHPLENKIASVGWDGKLLQWGLSAGSQPNENQHPGEVVTSVAYDSTGSRLVTLCRRSNIERSGRDVMVWDADTGDLLRTIPVPGPNWVESRADVSRSIVPSLADVGLIAVGDDAGQVLVFDLDSGEKRATLKGHGREILDVAFRPATPNASGRSASHLASASKDLTVRVWNVLQHRDVATLEGHTADVLRVLYSPDGQLLASASSDKTVRLWDANDHRMLAELPHGSIVYGLAFSPDGTRLVTGCADATVRLWDLGRHQEIVRLRGHQTYVHAVAFSSDGTRIVSASGDSTLRIWDTLTRTERGRGE